MTLAEQHAINLRRAKMKKVIYVDDEPMTVETFQVTKNLTVKKSLDLRGTAIASLPEGLSVGGSLDLCGTAITSLPESLSVGGSLDLCGTAITSLPEGLSVGGSLYLSDTAISPVGKDRRGYRFFAVRLANGPRIIAGCRNFSPEEARAHWAEGTECRRLAEMCIAALE